MNFYFALVCLFTAGEALGIQRRALQCQDITIPVNVTAQATDLPSTLPSDALADWGGLYRALTSAGKASISGGYNIAARYCAPAVDVPSRRQTLQVLVHGITYTRDYWSGLAPPGTNTSQDNYSWVLYAANQGYPTLAIDRLCNGASDHPNGVRDCQVPVQAETIHAIVQRARAGSLPGLGGKAFSKVIYVGHSFGSLIGNSLSNLHPTDIDSYVLTGYTTKLSNSGISAAVLGAFLPAAIVSPLRFGSLLSDLSYLQATNPLGVRTLFYYGDFDQAVFQYDFDHRGTVTIGEVTSGSDGQNPAPNYTGSLFVLNGNNDGLFCEDGQIQALLGVPGNCTKPAYSAGVQQNYPAVSAFRFHNTNNTGHCLNTHRTAQESFKAAHDFLAQVGY